MIIDCSSTIKGNWKWNSTTFVSQSYSNDDQFQEFGLKWQGHGFTYITTPKWIDKNNNNLDDFDLKYFCGSAIIVDIPDNKKINAQYIDEKLKNLKDKNINICIFATGHSIKFSNNNPEYWIKSPIIEDGIIEVLLKYSIKHLVLDFSCENILTKRDIEKKDFINPNEKIKIKLLEKNILLTENFIANHSSNYSFYIGLPISIPKGSTSPTRPILIDEWFGKTPKITDISTPLFNHWRWKLDIWEDTEILLNGQNRIETNFIFSGHGFNHCDAPRHMNKDGKTIQELPNQGLDIFINEANIIDLSDFDLPFKITRSMIEDKIKDTTRKKVIVLRTDLTNKVGYESKEWHLKAPYLDIDAANWIVENKYLSVCLDFPQDYIAREMPERMVYNKEFIIHHKIFDNGITFIEDLKDIGLINKNETLICAVPLKMDCYDGAPMRTIAIDW